MDGSNLSSNEIELLLPKKQLNSDKRKLAASTKKKCRFCSKPFLRLYDHQLVCKKTPNLVSRRLFCAYCCRPFSRRTALKVHVKNCMRIHSLTSRITCPYHKCACNFLTRISFLEHVSIQHDSSVITQPIEKTFESEALFNEWKNEEEVRTSAHYVQEEGGNGKVVQFYCQHFGPRSCKKIVKSSAKTTRKRPVGPVKTEKPCISFMVASHSESGVFVSYYPSHSHPLTPSDSKKRNGLHSNANQFKRLETGATFGEQMADQPDGIISLKLLTEVLVRDDPGFVLIYKPLGASCVIGPREIDELPDNETIFIYAFQTKEQHQLMADVCKRLLVIGETRGTNIYGFVLLTVMIVDDSKYGWPVAHCILSESDVSCMKYFFRELMEKCSDLPIDCVITDDDAYLTKAVEEAFGGHCHHILCKWNLTRNLREQIRDKASGELVEEMFTALKQVIDAKRFSNFQRRCDSFVMKYGPMAPCFVDYLVTYYLPEERVTKWAMCYRLFPHKSVDTIGHLESFHSRLKSRYMKHGPRKRIVELVQLLLAVAEDDLGERKNIALGMSTSPPSFSTEEHMKSTEIPDSSVVKIFNNMWSCSERCASGPQEFEVTRWNWRCDYEPCPAMCPFASCQGLCPHLYFCSCPQRVPLCQHIHKVQSLVLKGVFPSCRDDVVPDPDGPPFPRPTDEHSSDDEPETKGSLKEILKDNLYRILLMLETDQLPDDILFRVQNQLSEALKELGTSSELGERGAEE